MTSIIKDYTEMAAVIANCYSDSVSYSEQLSESATAINEKYKNGPTNIADSAQYIKEVTAHLELAVEKIREIMYAVERVQKSINHDFITATRAVFVGQINRKAEFDVYGQNIDESKIDLTPEVTNVKFVEYDYATDIHKFQATINERTEDYRVKKIVDDWIPILPSYFDKNTEAVQIHLNYILETLREKYNAGFNALASIDTADMISISNSVSLNFGIVPEKLRDLYHVLSNTAKNIEIIDRAFMYYLNKENILYSL